MKNKCPLCGSNVVFQEERFNVNNLLCDFDGGHWVHGCINVRCRLSKERILPSHSLELAIEDWEEKVKKIKEEKS